MKKYSFLFLLPMLLLAACGGGGDTGSSKMDYEETKKMVVDILKTDDGKKAIQEVMSDDKMKSELIMDQKVVKDTISKTLTSEKGTEFWKKSFEDPKFAETMAKSMKDGNEKLLKDLMKDPEYQGMMMDLMKDPEFQKELTEALKSKEFREHLQKVILETFESPLFKAKMQDILMKAAEEAGGGKQGEDGGGASQSGQTGGGQGGGGGAGGSSGSGG
ncbi:spore gernimation protein GerD [[Bacillus] enclensis]|jgi:spore germination protein D|uniref:Spore germination protein D n=1 Tax=[Bacillus] enclensis TaxID=1402860 RepID=A0A0V8H372_9BACI|nr:spore gernimation protein GerD [[Bacillus] enclensis]OAT84857.1 spore gernimation protein GerD [Bacillus sp. MKU004]QTC40909.1 spore gernimation protein GerD [Bacillus sp. V3]QWC23015.1 spore gernimation protein GerD [Bacillus haikouensis]SCC39063.1 spore germination protein D [[Bacillus] enclensis]